MSPTQNHANKEINVMNPSPLKINKDSHFIKKSSQSSSSSSTSSSLVINGGAAANTPVAPQPQRHPVIIYTHSPKIIHTNPKDFMALVQKLTGFSRPPEDDHDPPQLKSEPVNDKDGEIDNKNPNKSASCNDDNESSSVITDENGSSCVGDGQVNSCYVPQIFDPPTPCFNGMPFYNSSSTDFLCTNPPFYSYSDPLLMMPNMRNSMSSSTLDSMRELPEF